MEETRMKISKLLWGVLGGVVASSAVISSIYLLKRPQSDTPVPIQSASVDQLVTVIHINQDRAGQIVKLREEQPFEVWADLEKVSGLGLARIADIQTEGKLKL